MSNLISKGAFHLIITMIDSEEKNIKFKIFWTI